MDVVGSRPNIRYAGVVAANNVWLGWLESPLRILLELLLLLFNRLNDVVLPH